MTYRGHGMPGGPAADCGHRAAQGRTWRRPGEKPNRHDDFNSKNLDFAGYVGKFHPLLRFNQNLDFSQMGNYGSQIVSQQNGTWPPKIWL